MLLIEHNEIKSGIADDFGCVTRRRFQKRSDQRLTRDQALAEGCGG
jgi:hypothetical protein